MGTKVITHGKTVISPKSGKRRIYCHIVLVPDQTSKVICSPTLDETFRQPKIPSLIVELNFGFLSVVCILNYYKIIAFVLKRRSFPILLLQAESEGNFSVYL